MTGICSRRLTCPNAANLADRGQVGLSALGVALIEYLPRRNRVNISVFVFHAKKKCPALGVAPDERRHNRDPTMERVNPNRLSKPLFRPCQQRPSNNHSPEKETRHYQRTESQQKVAHGL